jgi:hypothetical protein
VRIKSQFKDYYDHMQKYVVGQSTVWNRSWCSMSSNLPTPRIGTHYQSYVGFCGKIYGFLNCSYRRFLWKTNENIDYEWNA